MLLLKNWLSPGFVVRVIFTMASRPYSRASITIPNLITLARILLTPLFIILLIQDCYGKALVVFLLAGLSDLADGLVARIWQQKSPMGEYLDPLADKLLMSSSFVTLSISHVIPSWLTVVVISRDVVIALGVTLFRLANLPLVISPTWLGKWTTTLQISTILLALIGKIWLLPCLLFLVLFWLTGLLTALSGVYYVYRGLRVRGQRHGRSSWWPTHYP